jgi:hypothetical protein
VRKILVKISVLASLSLFLSACDVIAEYLTGTGPCRRFAAPIDGFSISINDDDFIMNIGSTYELSVSRSWYDSNLDRESLDCDPDWIVDPPGALSVEGTTVTALSPASVRLTASVTGSGGTYQDYVDILVLPEITESEPNNGTVNADALDPGAEIVGVSNYYDDEDWLEVIVPGGAGFQVTMTQSVPDPERRWYYSYYGSVYTADERYVGDVNRTYRNSTDNEISLFVRVTGSGQVPYRVRLDLYP